MTVRYPEAARQHKALLQLLVLEILKNNTDPGNPITKQKIIEKATELCGFEPARNTIYDDIDALIDAGFPIEQSRKGVYYDGKSLSDGELRFLIDSVLYSDLMTKNGASEVIEALASLGSVDFQKYMEKQKSRISITRKSKQPNMFMAIEDIQTAIYQKKQISFNYLTYRPDCTQEKVYTEAITVNPYDLVYKNGRYFLLGALHDEKKICSWRVDRLCDVKPLKTGRRDVPQLKEISALGGMNAYVDTQPDLCGGAVETFKIQCSDIAMDEIVDVFGSNFQLIPQQAEHFITGVIILSVRTTRDAMKSWAITHADQVVILEPHEMREETYNALLHATDRYDYAEAPQYIRTSTANSFDEAVRLYKIRPLPLFRYTGMTLNDEPEKINISILQEIPNLTSLTLENCEISDPNFLKYLPNLTGLRLPLCRYPHEALQYATEINALELSECDPETQNYIQKIKWLFHFTLSHSDIEDISFLQGFRKLLSVSLINCKNIKDYTVLTKLRYLKSLTIKNCPIPDFSFIRELKRIKELEIEIPDRNCEKYQELQQFSDDYEIEAYGKCKITKHADD